jgi:hypothetical protein
MGDGGRGRATSCGGRHIAICERSERSVTTVCRGGAFGFLTLIQAFDGPDRYGASAQDETC